MNEYISREYALSCVDDFLSKTDMPIAAQFFYDCFRECEAANVQPAKHGYWEELEEYGDTLYRCSVCGEEWYLEDGKPKDNNMNFCPRCGAKMDGDTNG